MPTSSQALILQVTNESTFPPILSRGQAWQKVRDADETEVAASNNSHAQNVETPDQAFNRNPGIERRQEIIRSINQVLGQDQEALNQSKMQSKTNTSRRKIQKRCQPKTKPRARLFGSLPVLECKVDFSTLPQLLKVRGLHGSFRYDCTNNTLGWRINSIGPFYERPNAVTPPFALHQTKTQSNMSKFDAPLQFNTTARLVYTHANKQNYGHNEISNQEYLYQQYEQFESQGRIDIETRSSKGQGTTFKLVYSHTDPVTGHVRFNLRVCTPEEPGAFRLTSVNKGPDLGEFRIEPLSGMSADDIRLTRNSPGDTYFLILQRDSNHADEFKPVDFHSDFAYAPFIDTDTADAKDVNFSSNVKALRFKYGEENVKHNPRRAWDVHMPRFGNFSDYDEQSMNVPSSHYNSDKIQKTNPDVSTENRYIVFEDLENCVQTSIDQTYNQEFPDIYGNRNFTNTPQSSSATPTGLYAPSPIGRHGVPLKTHHATEATEHFMQNLSSDSPDVYNKLVSLGFRKAKIPESKHTSESQKPTGTERGSTLTTNMGWTSQDFDKWSRTTEAPAYQSNISNPGVPRKNATTRDQWKEGQVYSDYTSKSLTLQHVSSTIQHGATNADIAPPLKRNTFYAGEKRMSLIDEIKLKADYKVWKKKKITAVGMRKELPPEDRCALVLRLADNAISHDNLKRLIESNSGFKLKSLQFDPVSIHAMDSDAKSQWILRFDDAITCDNLIVSGLTIGGERVSIRRFNDVMREEHEAYKYHEIMKKMNLLKARKSKVSKHSETQTDGMHKSIK